MLSLLDQQSIKSLPKRRQLRRDPLIMLVEDDPLAQNLVKQIVTHKYRHVHIVDDGQQALIDYVEEAPDIVFLDINIPSLSGDKVLEQLLKIDPDAYVVMLTFAKDHETVSRLVDTGAQGYIAKPFAVAKIMKYIERSPLVKQKEMRRYASF
ncbi:MAG: hypothetical protein CMH30_06085 [Micavibrio sp.]|nr:hypothetical protein [Micavibrio sp.]|tara:strand:+ start:5908 stop:6363 length:456 start_codon:yes stop_codon:yes gene_type:complete